MAGPTFGIARRETVTPQILQLIASSARTISSSIRAKQDMDRREKEFNARQAEAQKNLSLREENLRLQQERLAFEQEREVNIEEERTSKQEARSARTERGEQQEKDRRTQLRIQAFRALDTGRRTAVNNSVRAIDKELARTRPLVQDPVLDADLVEFEGKSAQEIAAEVSRRKASFMAIAGDELKAADNPALVQTRQAALDAAMKALERRQGDFEIFAQSQGHRFAPDDTVRNNLQNGFMALIAQDLGVEVEGSLDISPDEKLNRASEKNTTEPPAPIQPDAQGDTTPGEPTEAATTARSLTQEFVTAADSDDKAAIQALRQEADTLPDDVFLARYRELEAAVGTERAMALMYGTK